MSFIKKLLGDLKLLRVWSTLNCMFSKKLLEV